jgi:hypothetical protein
MKVLTCSRYFPKGHPRQTQPTFFVEQILNAILPREINGVVNRDDISPAILPYLNDFVLLDGRTNKHHTIRAGSRFKPGDMASLRVWSDKPYRSKQIEFAQVEVKKVWRIEIWPLIGRNMFIGFPVIPGKEMRVIPLCDVATNDGLECNDFIDWFAIHSKKSEDIFRGQIISWSSEIEYSPAPLTEKSIS